jgi:hypothetical protein
MEEQQRDLPWYEANLTAALDDDDDDEGMWSS